MTDDELVALARQGDAASFGELVSRHQAAVYRAALAALAAVGSASDADDVAQEAFLLAYTRLRSFRGAASFKTWLLTIAWNQAINRRRANTRWWRRIVAVGPRGPMDAVDTVGPVSNDLREAETARSVCAVDTPEQLAAAAQLRRNIRQAIAELPRKLRDALLLAQSGEYSYQEIGAMLHAPVGTIKWRVSEARRIVKARLRARGYSDAG